MTLGETRARARSYLEEPAALKPLTTSKITWLTRAESIASPKHLPNLNRSFVVVRHVLVSALHGVVVQCSTSFALTIATCSAFDPTA